MPRSPTTFVLPPGTTPQVPNTVISSSVFNAFADDVAQTFNTIQPVPFGGTGLATLGTSGQVLTVNAGATALEYTTVTHPYSPGTLWGLTLSNNVTDPTNDIDIAVGAARNSIDTANIDLLSPMGKRYDAAWALGGTPAVALGGNFDATTTDGVKYVYAIKNPTTGVVDTGFSTNATTPTGGANYPAAYTLFRRIGSFTRTSGVNGFVISFSLAVNRGSWTPTINFNGASVGVTYTSQQGSYTVIGDNITLFWRIVITSKGSSGGVFRVGNLPTPSSGSFTSQYYTGSVGYASGMTGIVAGLGAYLIESGSNIVITRNTATGAQDAADTNLTNAVEIIGTITYPRTQP